jgi:cytochrome c
VSRRHACLLAALAIVAAGEAPAAEGDAKRGGEVYRACVACHSLESGVHLTGPSLAGLWGRTAGKADGFLRYSEGLKAADFAWEDITLNAWVADPSSMVPGTYMVFRGIEDERARADLIAFLEFAMAPDGAKAVVEQGLVPSEYVRGQQPDPLSDAPENVQVSAIRHCGDSYFVTTADGTETPFWEANIRLKVDSRATGPEPGEPVIVGAGMMGDRFSVIFSSVDELKRLVEEKC